MEKQCRTLKMLLCLEILDCSIAFQVKINANREAFCKYNYISDGYFLKYDFFLWQGLYHRIMDLGWKSPLRSSSSASTAKSTNKLSQRASTHPLNTFTSSGEALSYINQLLPL